MIEIPTELQQRGIMFVLLEKQGKKPFQKEWQNKIIEFDNPELISHISCGGNYGIRGGGEKKLVIVDFDNEEIQEKACKVLPETFTIKTGSGKLHKYFISDRCESFKIFSENMDTLADVQGEGKQVVGPNSIHPNGNKYSIINPREISYIPYSELKAILSPYDKKPKKEERVYEKPKLDLEDNFLDEIKSSVSIPDVLSSFGIDTSKNPTECYFHSSNGGKCLGFNRETAHCFHCDNSWNIFSFVKDAKKCSFKEALEYLANLCGMQDKLEESRRRYIDRLNENKRDEKRDLRDSFMDLIKEKKLADASELIANYILNKNYIYTTKDDNKSESWIYKDGIYVPAGKSEVKEIMRDILGKWYSSFYYNLVMSKLEPDTFIDSNTFFSNNYVQEIPVKNGILNVLTREIKEFTPDKIFFNKMPVEFNPIAECPQIDKFLSDVLSKEEDRMVFYEFGGFCLYKEYLFEKALMLIGDGRNGKDKSLELIKRLIGIENCCSVPLSSLIPDSFIISEFLGKMANIAGEINYGDLKDTSEFKGLTGRSLKTAPRKFLQPITFVNYAKFIFACNQLPMVYDTSKGFWDRWILLEYPFTFVDKDEYISANDKTNIKIRDESIIEKITTQTEMSGLLNKFLDGLSRLLQFRKFSNTAGSDEIKNMWIRKSNSVMAFCLDKIEDNYDNFITKKEFRREYSKYCKFHKITQKSDYVIKRTLEELFGSTEENKDYERVWAGIKWKNDILQDLHPKTLL